MQLIDLNEKAWQYGPNEYETKAVIPGVQLWLVPKFTTVHVTGGPETLLMVLGGRGQAMVRDTSLSLSGGVVLTELNEAPSLLKTENEELLLMEWTQNVDSQLQMTPSTLNSETDIPEPQVVELTEQRDEISQTFHDSGDKSDHPDDLGTVAPDDAEPILIESDARGPVTMPAEVPDDAEPILIESDARGPVTTPAEVPDDAEPILIESDARGPVTVPAEVPDDAEPASLVPWELWKPVPRERLRP